MSDYKRMVAYLYDYENQMKGNNTGYARIEIRNGQCKITISIKVANLFVTQLPIYTFKRVQGKMKCLHIGTLEIKNGMGEARFVVAENDLNGSGHSFSEMGGIIIYNNPSSYFGTEWDDVPIDLNKLELLNEEETAEAVENVSEDSAEVLDETQDIQVFSDMVTEEKEANVDELVEIESVDEIKKESINVEDSAKEEEETVKASACNLDISRKIFERYPHMYPFAGDQVIDCVKIEPQDIGNFPMEMWVLGNNSFLLHGYYSYRHLIFAKIQIDGVIKHIFGVPGTYQNRESFMARMFGFPCFMNIRGGKPENGEFGYYYMDLPFIN